MFAFSVSTIQVRMNRIATTAVIELTAVSEYDIRYVRARTRKIIFIYFIVHSPEEFFSLLEL